MRQKFGGKSSRRPCPKNGTNIQRARKSTGKVLKGQSHCAFITILSGRNNTCVTLFCRPGCLDSFRLTLQPVVRLKFIISCGTFYSRTILLIPVKYQSYRQQCVLHQERLKTKKQVRKYPLFLCNKNVPFFKACL